MVSKSSPAVVPMVAEERLWTIQDVSAFLVVPVATLHQWRYLGLGPSAYRVGRHLRYDPAAVRSWLSEQASVSYSVCPFLGLPRRPADLVVGGAGVKGERSESPSDATGALDAGSGDHTLSRSGEAALGTVSRAVGV